MQPLISPVDHEARSHNYDDDTSPAASEYTPLLQSYHPRRESKLTSIIVTLMILFLIFGIIISVFLFIEQDKKWPVNNPFEMVTRNGWGAKPPQYSNKNITNKPVTRIIITHTNSLSCLNMDACKVFLREMQIYYQFDPKLNKTDLPFNFLISPGGITYEGRGWDYCGDMDPEFDCTSLSVAAIGNFSTTIVPILIIEEFKAYLDEAIWRKKLTPNFEIIGRPFGESPESLFKVLRHWKHWKSK